MIIEEIENLLFFYLLSFFARILKNEMTNNINNEKCRLFASIFVVVVVVDHSHHH
jgi:AAA15 family ATPase/GTPase